MQTALYSILHMFVDSACALAMFGWFAEGEQGYLNILLYNFCAFALQMPLGTILDLRMATALSDEVPKRKTAQPFLYAALGVFFTILGTLTHPVILGIGNALFHVGGGVDVIREDLRKHRKGSALGIFVAPGAFGLYVGSLVAKSGIVAEKIYYLLFLNSVMLGLMVFLAIRMVRAKRQEIFSRDTIEAEKTVTESMLSDGTGKAFIILLCCFSVVILRSYVGMAVSFPWKNTVALGSLSVLAVVLGKMAGGILAAAFGTGKVMIISLLLSAGCYLLGGQVGLGIAAQFFFNMTMPVTLYLLVERFRKLPGFSFGLLTFGLFLGFLPAYLEVHLPVQGAKLGSAGSLVSLVLLLIAVRVGRAENPRET